VIELTSNPVGMRTKNIQHKINQYDNIIINYHVLSQISIAEIKIGEFGQHLKEKLNCWKKLTPQHHLAEDLVGDTQPKPTCALGIVRYCYAPPTSFDILRKWFRNTLNPT
jgi:hypothetical protein